MINQANLMRMWVNQPSTLQEWHKLHGQNVLMDDTEREDGKVLIYLVFDDTDFQLVHTQLVDQSILANGWKNQ